MKLRIHQVQDSGWGVFRMPLDVRIDTSAGSETVTVLNDALTQQFVLPATDDVLEAVVDEFGWVLSEKAAVPFVPGPPVIVETSPAPGAAFVEEATPANIRLFFSEPILPEPGQFVIESAAGGAVLADFASSDAEQAVTLTPAAPLMPGLYTVAVADTLVSNLGLALDGELDSPTVPASLPSGDGLPGGSAVFTFRVFRPCPGDVNIDGVVGLDDLAVLLNHYGQTKGATAADGDMDDDGDVDLGDMAEMLGAFGAVCD